MLIDLYADQVYALYYAGKITYEEAISILTDYIVLLKVG